MKIYNFIALLSLMAFSFSAYSAPIIYDESGGGSSSVGSFSSGFFHGQTFLSTEQSYTSVGFYFDEVYGPGSRDSYADGTDFRLRFQLFAGSGWDGQLLQTIEVDPGAGFVGHVDFDVREVAFDLDSSYTAIISMVDESAGGMWMMGEADNRVSGDTSWPPSTYDVYEDGVAISWGQLDPDSIVDQNFRVLTDYADDGYFAAHSVPEPSAAFLVLFGVVGLGLAKNKRRLG